MNKLNIDVIKNKNNLTYEETKFLQNAYFKSTMLWLFTAVLMLVVVLIMSFALHVKGESLDMWKEIASRARWNEGTTDAQNKTLKAKIEKMERDEQSYQRIIKLANERGDMYEDALCMYGGMKSACKTAQEKADRERMRQADPKCTYVKGEIVCSSVSYVPDARALMSKAMNDVSLSDDTHNADGTCRKSPSISFGLIGALIPQPIDPNCVSLKKD